MKRLFQDGGYWRCDTCLRMVRMYDEPEHMEDETPVCDLPEDVARQAWRDSANRIADQETSGPTT